MFYLAFQWDLQWFKCFLVTSVTSLKASPQNILTVFDVTQQFDDNPEYWSSTPDVRLCSFKHQDEATLAKKLHRRATVCKRETERIKDATEQQDVLWLFVKHNILYVPVQPFLSTIKLKSHFVTKQNKWRWMDFC